MAYREHGMWEVLEVLRRVHGGEAYRSVARATGRSPKTVRRYVRLARKLGWSVGTAPDEALAARIVARLRPGPQDAAESAAHRQLVPHRERLREWLAIDRPGDHGPAAPLAPDLDERRRQRQRVARVPGGEAVGLALADLGQGLPGDRPGREVEEGRAQHDA